LPALNELQKMKAYATNNTTGGNGCAAQGGRGNFACAAENTSYWSSTEYSASNAYAVDLNGRIDSRSTLKYSSFSVRPIKRF
jgi:hypothetical protein